MADQTGTAGDDTLIGGVGDDTISGGEGNDRIDGGDGADDLYGDGGNDTIDGGFGLDRVDGGDGNDFIVDYFGGDELHGGSGDDYFAVRGTGSRVYGDDGEDYISLDGSISATIDAGAGDDELSVGGTQNLLTGGSGVDNYLFWGLGFNTITDFTAGAGGDVIDLSKIVSYSLTNYVGPNPFGSGHLRLVQVGSDTFLQVDANGAAGGASFADLLKLTGVSAASLTAENFSGYSLDGSPSAGFSIAGTAGDDTLIGGVGDDTISGGEGNDRIDGGDGADDLYGDGGNDTIDGGFGLDRVDGGDGNDFIVDYFGGDELHGGSGDDYFAVRGTGSRVYGDDGEDYISLDGSISATIDAGAGDDELSVGGTQNLLTGGSGVDNYLFWGLGFNTITDFTAGAGGDVIDLSKIVSYSLTNYVGPNPFGSGHLRLVQVGSDTFLQVDANGAAGGASFADLLKLTGVSAASLTAENFSGYSANVVPTANGLPTDVTVTEDVASNLDLSAVTLADVDTAGTITVSLTSSAGTMTASSGGGVTVSNSGTGVLTLSGTVSAIDTFLNTASAVQYTGASNVNGDNAATVTVTAND
ncbi:MAG: calcium-binding protein, partial [Caulobacter sp.]